jgi:hypothetical protein
VIPLAAIALLGGRMKPPAPAVKESLHDADHVK